MVIAEAGLVIEHLSAVRRDQGRTVWEITLEIDEAANRDLYDRIDQLPIARFLGKSDRVFNRHRGGKIKTVASLPINTLQVLRDVYTPVWPVSVSPSRPIRRRLTNSPTSITRSRSLPTAPRYWGWATSARLAGLPVMEGKAALFADLVGLSGVPILLSETQPDRVVDVVAAIEQSFGAIQLEDIAAPECFEIERKLRERVAKPVLHDDQHGTAVVALAALINAARQAGRNLRDSVIGQIGLGAAGTGIVRMLRAYGVAARARCGSQSRCDCTNRGVGRSGRLASGHHGSGGYCDCHHGCQRTDQT